MLPDYNAQTIILQANQASGFFDESYLKKEYICIILYADRLLKLKTRDYLLMLDIVIPNTCKK